MSEEKLMCQCNMPQELEKNVKEHAVTLLSELQSEMRAIRDAELKMVPFFFAVAAFVLTANLLTVLNENASLSKVLWVTIPSLVFILAFWWQLHERLNDEHKKYSDHGKRVRQLWDLWGVTEFCKQREGHPKFGLGLGYRKSQGLIASSALLVVLIILATTIIKVAECICP